MTTPTLFPLLDAAEEDGESFAYQDSERRVSYGQLWADVEVQAASLRKRGVTAGKRVMWCPANDYQSLLTFWSLIRIGGVACPVSPRFPSEIREEITASLQAFWLADDGGGQGGAKSQGLAGQPLIEADADSSDADRSVWGDETAPATIILSSGSTGTPKAIVHSLQAHVANAVGSSTNIPLTVGDRWLWSLPLYHISGLSILIRCAMAHATVFGMVGSANKLSALALAESDITHVSLVPTQLRRLLQRDDFPAAHLKAVLLGGSAFPESLVREAVRRGVPLHSTYGMTETASQVTTTAKYESTTPLTSGVVLPRRELMIRDGEILVRGETLCLGYLRAGVVERITNDDGWFATGDRGYLDSEGRLIVDGRLDNMFVSGGENVYPETIERALLQLDGVEQAIVVPRADPEFGARPVAFVQHTTPGLQSSTQPEAVMFAEWVSQLKTQLRSFEIPEAFFPWPDDASQGIKASRAKFQQLLSSFSG